VCQFRGRRYLRIARVRLPWVDFGSVDLLKSTTFRRNVALLGPTNRQADHLSHPTGFTLLVRHH
jgi:hypothetical protein